MPPTYPMELRDLLRAGARASPRGRANKSITIGKSVSGWNRSPGGRGRRAQCR